MRPSASDAGVSVRKARVIVGLLAAVTLSVLAACTPAEQDKQTVATVNGREITVGDLLTELRRTRGAHVLVAMIDSQLVLAAAAERGVSVSEDELQLRLERAISEAGSEADFEARLEAMHTTCERFRQRLRVDLLLDKLAKAEMHIDEQELKDFYREHEVEFHLGERVRARMMLFASQGDAKAVYEALQQPGSDFAGLARSLSLDPATNDQGGDMGYFERDDYATEISDVAFSLEVGQISEVFKAPDGYCIVKVEDSQPASLRPLSDLAHQLRARIAAAKLPSARRDWIVKARRAAHIAVTDEQLRDRTLGLLENAPPPQPVSLMPVLGT